MGAGMRVFVTGATGFLGGAFARALARQGAEIHALFRKASDRGSLEDVRIAWHECDITDAKGLSGLFDGAQWIIHAAGLLGRPGLPESVLHSVNADGTANVMAAAFATGAKPRVLHVSSPGILGPTGPEPATEKAPLAPTNAYERSKAAAETIALTFAAKGLPMVVARPGFIYGPGDRQVLRLFRAIRDGRFFYIDAGRHLCQPTFVADAIDGMLACLRRGSNGGVYNIAGPRPVTFRELVKTIADALGVRPPRWSLPRPLATLAATGLEAFGYAISRPPPLARSSVDFFSDDRVVSWQKAYREIGYDPAYDLAAGVTATVTWYREHGWL
jgi:nucleoside-diphosphate-sugar epimerase